MNILYSGGSVLDTTVVCGWALDFGLEIKFEAKMWNIIPIKLGRAMTQIAKVGTLDICRIFFSALSCATFLLAPVSSDKYCVRVCIRLGHRGHVS